MLSFQNNNKLQQFKIHKFFVLDSVSSSEAQDSPKKIKKAMRLSAAAVYKTLMQAAEDDEESDSNDETFEGGEVNSSDDENVNGISDSDCEYSSNR